jgi:hypothetical protein
MTSAKVQLLCHHRTRHNTFFIIDIQLTLLGHMPGHGHNNFELAIYFLNGFSNVSQERKLLPTLLVGISAQFS